MTTKDCAVFDSDSHVVEPPALWEKYLAPEYRTLSKHALWRQDGRTSSYLKVNGEIFRDTTNPNLPRHALWRPGMSWDAIGELDPHTRHPMTEGASDPKARLADMDRHGITCQVVYPTLFLVTLAEELGLERALCQAYNRFMSEACAKSRGRIYFAAVVPTQYAPDAIQVAREAKELGAVSVMVPGLLWDKPLSDESFLPFYEELARLNLPLGVHVAWGSPSLTNIFSKPEDGAFGSFILPVVMGFWSLMTTGVYDRFPELKVAFLEAGCEWPPYAINQLDRAYHQGRYELRQAPSDYLRLGNIYLACEAEEDLEYVLRYVPDDQLTIASDYPHADPSMEEDIVHALEEHQAKLPASTREKILSANPIRLYNLSL